MSVMTTAGSVLSVSAAAPATYNDAGFNALTWTTVGEITDLGDGLGRTYTQVTHNPVASRLTQKLKGSYDPGAVTFQFGRDFTDAGQTILKTAASSDATYSFKVTLQNGQKLCWQGLVGTFAYTLSGVDTITAASTEIWLQKDLLELAS